MTFAFAALLSRSASSLSQQSLLGGRRSLVRVVVRASSSSDGFFADDDDCPDFASAGVESPVLLSGLSARGLVRPSAVQAAAFGPISAGGDVVVGAETGSGKTLAYLLPVIERMRRKRTSSSSDDDVPTTTLLLTPTRELACQVAGVAEALLGFDDARNDRPDVLVRLVTEPTNLADDAGRGLTERGEVDGAGGRRDRGGAYADAPAGRIVVGSARSILVSLYGDGKAPAPPTPRPLATGFFRSVRWLVLDEVDRLLNVPKSRADKKKAARSRHDHEKPAAVLTSAVVRLSGGRAQTIACSATVGRPVRRELARVMGLPASHCPAVIRGVDDDENNGDEDDDNARRLVTVPPAVENYVLPCDGSSSGSLLTAAAFAAAAARTMSARNDHDDVDRRRVLLVLTRDCGLSTRDAVGALRHLGAHPDPRPLADALRGRDSEHEADADGAGTDRSIREHRRGSGVAGVGAAPRREDGDDDDSEPGYLLVTGEDSVRGLHLHRLDAVVVVGKPGGPDEYAHIAGRTGRAGARGGRVLNVVGYEQAAALTGWERTLGVDFVPVDESGAAEVLSFR